MSITLREYIASRFDLEELRTLCYDLGVEYDDLRGEGRAAKIRELVASMERTGRLDKLVEAVRKTRSKDFENADVIVERELVPTRLESIRQVAWWRRNWKYVGLLALTFVLVSALVVIVAVAPWKDDRETATPTAPPVAQVETPVRSSATPTLTTPSATAVPPPTPSPTTRQPSDVLIAEFDTNLASIETARVAHRLETDLQDRLRRTGLSDVTVSVISSPVTDEEQARALAIERRSKVVIWGWYDQSDIQVRIFLAGEGPWRDQPATNLVPLKHSSETQELTILVEDVVEEELADDVSFLSLFVIGHLHYLANEYQEGYAAFDAAMEDMPENAQLQNKALLLFFEARQLEAEQSDDVVGVICKYAEAIELDPVFAEAYNNLGIIFAQQFGGFKSPDALWLPDEARSCLAKAGLEGKSLSAPALFDVALELQPGWAVAEYNKLGFYWQRLDWLSDYEGIHPGDAKEWLKTGIEDALKRDPSIPGAYVVLGTMALEASDFEAAVEWFSSALALISAPESAKVHFNQAIAYLHLGQEKQAEFALEAALAADPNEAEANLALANLAYRQGQQERTMKHLDAILPSEAISYTHSIRFSPSGLAIVLQSRVLFDAGDINLSIETLEQYASSMDSLFSQGYGGTSVPLERYLLGLLYTLNDNTEMASWQWSTIKYNPVPDLNILTSSENVWYDIIGRCGELSWTNYTLDWDAAGDPCLPTDLRDRITAVYDMFQDQLSERYYFRSVFYSGLACPYVFTRNTKDSYWRWDTTILYNLAGRENEALQRRRLARFDGQLLIRELEREVSYIDQLYVMITREDESTQILRAPLEVLLEADNRYLTLRQGDQLLLHFAEYSPTPGYSQAWVVAKGYYVPLWTETRD